MASEGDKAAQMSKEADSMVMKEKEAMMDKDNQTAGQMEAMKAGETLKTDGYHIETQRVVKAGDSISVLLVGDSLMSVEAVLTGVISNHSQSRK